MHTHKQLAEGAALAVLLVDAQARMLKATHEERFQLVAETVMDVLRIAQDELLASQQETAVALAEALNMANGK